MSHDIPSFEDAINEYYKLKNKFENDNMSFKKKLINNPTLSKKEKRAEFLKFKPLCVNCKRRSNKGTLFSTTFHGSHDKGGEYRKLKASCGDLADPCDFEIEINVSITENYEQILRYIQKEIKFYKDKIIDDKNKLLFGLITTETAIDNFDSNKSYVTEFTNLYEMYFKGYIESTDSKEKKELYEQYLVEMYKGIDEIKEYMKKMDANNNSRYAVDAVNIYQNKLYPLLLHLRKIKYSDCYVYHDDNTDTCRLIQNKISIKDLESNDQNIDKVITFDVGLTTKKKPKKPLFIIESDESSEQEPKIKIDIKKPEEKLEKIPPDEPVFGEGEDGISWTHPEYQKLWTRLPKKLKNEFKTNIDWMSDFMFKCVNTRQIKGNNGCELTTPPNLIVPPKYNEETKQYDLGVPIYTKTFNALNDSIKQVYLTLYKSDPSTGAKNYSMFEEAMNKVVGKELDFDRGFF